VNHLPIVHNGEILAIAKFPGFPARGDVIILPIRYVVERIDWTVLPDGVAAIVVVQPVEMP
jgi:hypothetical protein